MIEISWDKFKSYVQTHNLVFKHIEDDEYYFLWAVDGNFYIQSRILKSDSVSILDFETNFKPNSNKPLKSRVLTEPADVALTLYKSPDVMTVNAGQEIVIDLQLAPESSEVQQILYGGALYADSPGFEDYVRFQVIDVDGVLGYGAGLVLKEYIKKAYLNNNNTFEDYDDAGAYLPVGLYLRCIYKSTKESGSTKVKINYLLGVPG